MFVKQEVVEKPAAGAVQIAVEFRTRNETKLFQFKVAENMLFGTLRNRERHRHSGKTGFRPDF